MLAQVPWQREVTLPPLAEAACRWPVCPAACRCRSVQLRPHCFPVGWIRLPPGRASEAPALTAGLLAALSPFASCGLTFVHVGTGPSAPVGSLSFRLEWVSRGQHVAGPDGLSELVLFLSVLFFCLLRFRLSTLRWHLLSPAACQSHCLLFSGRPRG